MATRLIKLEDGTLVEDAQQFIECRKPKPKFDRLRKALICYSHSENVSLKFFFLGFFQPPTLIETLQAWAKLVSGEDVRGKLFIILDQFEEYFLYHQDEDGEGTFAVEFPRAVNCPFLLVNFLISIREDSLAKLDRFKSSISPGLLENSLRIEHLDTKSARDAIVKPLGEYNLQQIIINNLKQSRLTLLSGVRGSGKSRILRVGTANYLNQLALQKLEERCFPEFIVAVFNSWQKNLLADLKEQIRSDIESILEKRHFDIMHKLLLCCSSSEKISSILWFPFIFDLIYQTLVRQAINSVASSLTLTKSLQAWTEIFGGKLLIVLDQFEQYFQYHSQEYQKETFLTELSNALSHNDLAANFLISLRENTLPKLNSFKKKIPDIFDNHLHLKQRSKI